MQCFLWEIGASVGWTVTFLTSDIFYMHKNLYNTSKERETMKKHNSSPLKKKKKKNSEQSRSNQVFFLILFLYSSTMDSKGISRLPALR